MAIPSKILWAEGLRLSPQLFQQQDRYHEGRLHQTAEILHPYSWGVRKAVLDLESLKTNTLAFSELSIVFPDGEMCDAPNSTALPQPIDLAALGADVQHITYYAALPSLVPSGGNLAAASPATPSNRFSDTILATPDLFTQAVAENVRYLKTMVRLVPDHESLGGYDRFPLVRLRRTVTGGFEPDAAFTPPCVSIGSSVLVSTQLKQLINALQAKFDSLQEQLREPSRNVIEFRSSDVASFWLLHSVSTATASLTHFVHHPGLHPERLFQAELALAGALITYSKIYKLSDLPVYAHEVQGRCFARLDAIIRDLLDTVISAKYFSIALDESRIGYYQGKLDTGKIDQNTTLYLAVNASIPALQLVDIIPQRMKIGAPTDVEKIVLAALPGVKLSHAPQVPAAIPVRPDTYYFSLDSKSVLYEQMLKAQSILIYAPSGIQDLQLELLAVVA